jgi:hypothetical protein
MAACMQSCNRRENSAAEGTKWLPDRRTAKKNGEWTAASAIMAAYLRWSAVLGRVPRSIDLIS